MAWIYLERVCTRVLGGDRDAEPEWVKEKLHYFEIIGALMTLKFHFLHFHFDDFIKQLPIESDEQGERFHQTTMRMEKRYKGKSLDGFLQRYVGGVTRIPCMMLMKYLKKKQS